MSLSRRRTAASTIPTWASRARARARTPPRGGGDAALLEALLAEKVLAPLGMVNATFDTAKVLAADQRAVGTTSSGDFVNVSNTSPTPGAPGGWGAPCGCLWASADDMAKFIQLYFRDDVPSARRRRRSSTAATPA